jgi:hypothetical protein
VSALLQADPHEVRLCALRLEDAAQSVWHAQQAAGRAEAAAWRGPAQRSFDSQLSTLRGRLEPIGDANEAMSEVLHVYSAVLAEAQVTSQRAQQLAEQAARLPAATPAQAEHRDLTLLSATRLMREAEEQERAAGRRAAAALREIQSRAPRAGRLTSSARFLDDLGGVAADSAVGTAHLGLTALSALPVGDRSRQQSARRELVTQAKESLKVWQPFVDAYRSAADGRWGQTVGSLGAVIAFRRGGRLHHVDPSQAERGQSHHAKDIRRRIEAAGAVTAGTRSPHDRVNLLHHEQLGGHTLLKHVGRPDEYLAWRAHDTGAAATSFPDERTATKAVAHALQLRAADVEKLLRAESGRLVLTVDTGRTIGGGFQPGRPTRRETSVVCVVLDRIAGRSVHVTSAFPLL